MATAVSTPGWLERLREQGRDRFSFPSRNREDYRFTSVEPIEKAKLPLAAAPKAGTEAKALASKALAPFDAYRLTFLDGRYVPDLSQTLPKGVLCGSLAALLKTAPERLELLLGKLTPADKPFAALNAADFADGAALILPKGAELDKPLHLFFVSSGAPVAAHTRVLVFAEPGARATVIEERSGEAGAYWTNAVTEVYVEESASVEHLQLQRESDSAFHTHGLFVRVGRSARFRASALSLGAALSRHDAAVALDDEGAEAELDGLYVVNGRQHVDHHTVVRHLRPHGSSRVLYKGVLDGEARAVFNGRVDVEPAAQKTDANVHNKNLLLSAKGLVNTNPEFKIHANDVQCRHGATIGQLSADAMFYLRSRGLGAEEAKALLVYAFASEMIERLPVEPVKDALRAELSRRLSGGAR